MCILVNEVICYGIFDKCVFFDGDIVNFDVIFYYEGFYGDFNEIYYVGDCVKVDFDIVWVVEVVCECLDKVIVMVKFGIFFCDFGNMIEVYVKSKDCSVICIYVGYGINCIFYCFFNIFYYVKNKVVGECKFGMIFIIEFMIVLGKYRDIIWFDNWISIIIDGKKIV